MQMILMLALIVFIAACILWMMEGPSRQRIKVVRCSDFNDIKYFGKRSSLFKKMSGLEWLRKEPIRIIRLSNTGDSNWVWNLFELSLQRYPIYVFENKLTGFYKVFFTQTVYMFARDESLFDIGIFSKQITKHFPGERDPRIKEVETRKHKYDIDRFNILSSVELNPEKLSLLNNILNEKNFRWNLEVSKNVFLCYRLNQFLSKENFKNDLEVMDEVVNELVQMFDDN